MANYRTPTECPSCGAVTGHALDCAARARILLGRAQKRLAEIQQLVDACGLNRDVVYVGDLRVILERGIK